MFNKKLLLAALAVLGTTAALVGCSGEEFEQNTSSYVAPEETMYIVGSHWNGWWNGVTTPEAGTKFSRSVEDSNVYEYDLTISEAMLADWVGFKFTASAGWDQQYGLEDVAFEECNQDFLNLLKVQDKHELKSPATNRSNVEFKDGALVAGTFHIEYRPFNFYSEETTNGAQYYTKKFVIEFTPAA